MNGALHLVLSQTEGISVPLEYLFQFGLPGVFIALLISGQLALGREVKELKSERDRYRDANETIIESLSTVPTSQAATLEALVVIKTMLENLQSESKRRQSESDQR